MQIETVSLATTGGLKVNNEFFCVNCERTSTHSLPDCGSMDRSSPKNQEMRIHLD